MPRPLRDHASEGAAIVRWIPIIMLTMLLVGCASATSATPAALVALALLLLAACGAQPAPRSAPSSDTVGSAADADSVPAADGEGTIQWHPCCKQGKVSSCQCPANSTCNWSMCLHPDGSCGEGQGSFGVSSCPSDASGGDATSRSVDADDTDSTDVGDADDTTDVSDVADVSDVDDVAPDAGDADAGVTWHPCCINGKVSSCACEASSSCNWSLCVNPDGTCGPGEGAFGVTSCTPDASDGDGTGASFDAGDAVSCDDSGSPDAECGP